MKEHLASLAELGIYLGTSSWKYPGWAGSLYEEARYVFRGKFSETRFNRICLEEYAQVFKTVSVDAAYYTFPTEKYIGGLVDQVPADFRFALKVTDEITVKHFPNLTRFGPRAGKPNTNFLNPDLFASSFLRPLEPFKESIGLIMFEFSRFYPRDFKRGREFVHALEAFLTRLPKGWPYGVEIRNRNLLQPEYFQMLREHEITHVYNNWDAMPAVEQQLEIAESPGRDDLTAARFLLKPGRKYKDAVALFSPYRTLKEPDESARRAGAKMIRQALRKRGGSKTFVLVNNRLEGNALITIQEMLQEAAQFPA
ncbi:DUF72 domain-containing protein [Verrucomicrobia bacterium]|nr:DUF72 domain-containing protein [Verrucomicrobiota bacterium]